MIAKTPSWLFGLHKKSLFRVKSLKKELFLTFDDGPVPGVTDWVLDELAKYEAKACFFVLGKQVNSHPELYHRIINEGHSIGNHSYNHPNGWKTKTKDYLEDFALASELIDSNLIRPPYGKIKWKQLRELSKNNLLVFWDVLAGDYSSKLSPEEVTKRVCNSVRPGSIVVLHDSLKSEHNLKNSLPEILQYLSEENYEFKALTTAHTQ